MADYRDIIVDDNNELSIINGDFVADASEKQDIKLILESSLGHWKQYPLIGANILQMLNGDINDQIKRNIRIQLLSDKFNVKSINYINEQLTIDATR